MSTKSAMERTSCQGEALDVSVKSALTLWFSLGSRYGESAFRRIRPRQNPVVAYWLECGLAVPTGGLSEEGVNLMATHIRKGQSLPASLMRGSTQQRLRRPSWQVLISLLKHGIEPPSWVIFYQFHRAFGAQMEQIRSLIRLPNSAHEALEQRHRLSQLPEIDEVLSLPGSVDASFLVPYL